MPRLDQLDRLIETCSGTYALDDLSITSVRVDSVISCSSGKCTLDLSTDHHPIRVQLLAEESWASIIAPLVTPGDRITMTGAIVVRDRPNDPIRIVLGQKTRMARVDVVGTEQELLGSSPSVLTIAQFTDPQGNLDQGKIDRAAEEKKKIARSHTYHYVPLKNLRLRMPLDLSNFYAFVTSFSPPKPTAKADYVATFHVTDLSLVKQAMDVREEKSGVLTWPSITLNVFGPQESLPRKVETWDIIRCHRVFLSEHQSKIQGALNRKSNSSFVLFHGASNEGQNLENSEYFKNSKTMTFEAYDKKILSAMRQMRENVRDLHQKLDSGVAIEIPQIQALTMPMNSSRAVRSESATITDQDGVPFTCLSAVLSSRDPCKLFKCRVNVRNYYPRNVAAFVFEMCTVCHSKVISKKCQVCDSSFGFERVCMFSLHLSDQTGSIPVQVSYEEAQKFLCNTPADRILSRKESLQLLMDQLLSQETWIDVLIKSFTSENQQELQFQVFGTTLKYT